MRKEFFKIYKDLSNAYEARLFINEIPFPIRPIRWVKHRFRYHLIRQLIWDAAKSCEVKLRPDAEHFLLVNFSEMFLVPMSHSDNTVQVNKDELYEIIKQDVKSIINNVKERENNNKEISGNAVLKSAASVIDSLKISGFQFWGGKENGE